MNGPHEYSVERGECICEYGCSNCGFPIAMMGNCAAWEECPIGRAPVAGCPVHESARKD